MGDVILFKEDVDQLNALLKSLANDAKILSALLITKDTRVLACQGSLSSGDTGALGALLVGCFASTQAIAGLIGETEFDTLTHHGKTRHIVISLIDDNTILASLFDKNSSAERIQASVSKHLETLRKALRSIGSNTTQDLFDTGSSSAAASDIGDEFDMRADALHKSAESDRLKSSGEGIDSQFPNVAKGGIPRPPDTEMITVEQPVHEAEVADQPYAVHSEPAKKNLDDSAARKSEKQPLVKEHKRTPPETDANRPRSPAPTPAPGIDQAVQPHESGHIAPSDTVHVSMNYLKNKTREGALYYHYDKTFFKKFFKSSHKKKS